MGKISLSWAYKRTAGEVFWLSVLPCGSPSCCSPVVQAAFFSVLKEPYGSFGRKIERHIRPDLKPRSDSETPPASPEPRFFHPQVPLAA